MALTQCFCNFCKKLSFPALSEVLYGNWWTVIDFFIVRLYLTDREDNACLPQKKKKNYNFLATTTKGYICMYICMYIYIYIFFFLFDFVIKNMKTQKFKQSQSNAFIWSKRQELKLNEKTILILQSHVSLWKIFCCTVRRVYTAYCTIYSK